MKILVEGLVVDFVENDDDEDGECGDDGFAGCEDFDDAMIMVILMMMVKATILIIRWCW
jgi:hypothetical protein